MTAALILGISSAFGALVILSGLAPRRVPLTMALDQLHRSRLTSITPRAESLFVRLVGYPLSTTSPARALCEHFIRDLRITETTRPQLVSRLLLCATVGLAWAPTTFTLMAIGGVQVSWFIPAWVSVAFAGLGGLLPLVSLRSSASERRRTFRHALSCFLDLVAVRLAGGAGVDSALAASANSGDGWAFNELRLALAESRRMGEPPWTGLDRLGAEIGVRELSELAASVALAGDEGARVRTSIAAKARAIRVHGLADAEAAASSASERMSLPIVLLMLGFVVFLGYPAVTQVLVGL